jgi:hypothetical protein
MRVLGIAIIAMALVIAIAPQFTNCEAQGGTTAKGMQMSGSSGMTTGTSSSMAAAKPAAKMKCLWTARAGIGVAIPLAAAGAFLFFSRRRETVRALGVTTAALGLVTILLPAALIGTCVANSAVCNTTMAPIMYAAGGITMALGVVAVVVNELKREVAEETAVGLQPAT